MRQRCGERKKQEGGELSSPSHPTSRAFPSAATNYSPVTRSRRDCAMSTTACILALLNIVAAKESGRGGSLVLVGPNGHRCRISVGSDGALESSCPFRATPVAPPPPPEAYYSRFIAGGYNFNCGVDGQSKIHCSGASSASALNTALANYDILQAGGNHAARLCFVTLQHKFYCMTDFSSDPTPSLMDIGGRVIYTQSGYEFSCAIMEHTLENAATSRLKCWGSSPGDTSIGYGFGVSKSPSASLEYIGFGPAGGGRAVKVAATHNGVCALVEDSTCPSKVMCWGDSQLIGAATPKCVDFDSMSTASSKSYSGSSDGLYAIDLSLAWNHGEGPLAAVAVCPPCPLSALPLSA